MLEQLNRETQALYQHTQSGLFECSSRHPLVGQFTFE